MARCSSLLAVCLAVGMGVAQHWEVEPVDSVRPGSAAFLRRHPDGRVKVCYESPDAAITLAWKDTAWHRERVPPIGELDWYSIGPRGEEGMCGGNQFDLVDLALRRDSLWEVETLSFQPRPMRAVCAFDTAGWPRIAYTYAVVYPRRDFIFFQKTDTGWEAQDTWGWESGLGLWTDSADQPVLFRYYYFEFPAGEPDWYIDAVTVSVRRQDTWYDVQSTGARNGSLGAYSTAMDTAGVPHLAAYVSDPGPPPTRGFYLDREYVTQSMGASALAYDSLNQPLIACLSGTTLSLKYRTPGGWHDVPVPGEFSGLNDILIDSTGCPLILAQNAGMLYIIRGVDVVGAAESEVRQPGQAAAGIVLRRGEVLRSPHGGRLVDVTGRVRTRLAPGSAHAVTLPPGVHRLLAPGHAPVTILILP